MNCKHHYEWRGDKLVCVRCGHRRLLTYQTKRHVKIVSVLVGIIIVGFFIYQNLNVLTNKVDSELPKIEQSPYTKPILTKISTLTANISQATTNSPILLGPSPSLTELRQVALDDLNNYRKQHGIGPVTLGNAKSPQLYSQELLQERCIHHIDSKGEGPMLRYKNNGDTMYLVGENIAADSDAVLTNPKSQVLKENYEMMFDDAGSNWGHQKNILDPQWSSVSIGIATIPGQLVMVQDFQASLQPGYEYDPSSFETEPQDAKSCW